MNQLLEANPLSFYIIAGIGLFIGVYFLFRNSCLHTKMIFMCSSCTATIIFFFINRIDHIYVYKDHFLSQLPFHLCQVSLFFTPIALRFKFKVFYDFIFYISSFGAVFAVVFPAKTYIDGVLSIMTVTYFLYHFLVIVVPLWLFLWKMYNPRISFKSSLRLFGFLLLLTVFMHGLNVLLVSNGVENANYFWTLVENGRYNNVVLELFASILPVDFFYLLFCIPILYTYIGIWNLSLLLVEKLRKRNV